MKVQRGNNEAGNTNPCQMWGMSFETSSDFASAPLAWSNNLTPPARCHHMASDNSQLKAYGIYHLLLHMDEKSVLWPAHCTQEDLCSCFKWCAHQGSSPSWWCAFPSSVLVFWTFVQPLPALDSAWISSNPWVLRVGFGEVQGSTLDSAENVTVHLCKGQFQSMATQMWMLCFASQLWSKEPLPWDSTSHTYQGPQMRDRC